MGDVAAMRQDKLKRLIVAKLRLDESDLEKFLNRLEGVLEQRLGLTRPKKKSPKITSTRNEFYERKAEIIARRLAENDRTKKLFSNLELVDWLQSQIVKDVAPFFLLGLASNKEKFREALRDFLESLAGVLDKLESDSYEEYRSWVVVLSSLADDNDPEDSDITYSNDELYRKVYSREQFRTKLMAMEALFDPELITGQVIDPALKIVELSFPAFYGMAQNMKAEIVKELDDVCRTGKDVLQSFVDERVKEVYPHT